MSRKSTIRNEVWKVRLESDFDENVTLEKDFHLIYQHKDYKATLAKVQNDSELMRWIDENCQDCAIAHLTSNDSCLFYKNQSFTDGYIVPKFGKWSRKYYVMWKGCQEDKFRITSKRQFFIKFKKMNNL